MAAKPQNRPKSGYKLAPEHTRFRPGKSGNPKGRPKGTRNLKTDLAEELAERVVVTENGKARSMSRQRALIKRLANKGLQGDAKSIDKLLALSLRLVSQAEETQPVNLSEKDEEILKRFEDRVAKRLKSGGGKR